MRLGRLILTSLLAIMWLAMPVHCQIEVVTATALFDCSTETDCSSPDDAGCKRDFCASVESASYLLSRADALVTGPGVCAVLWLNTSVLQIPAESAPVPETDYLPRSNWHFVFRAAGDPRAPSFLA